MKLFTEYLNVFSTQSAHHCSLYQFMDTVYGKNPLCFSALVGYKI